MQTVALCGCWEVHSWGVLKILIKWCHQPSLLTSHAILSMKFCFSPYGDCVLTRTRHPLCKGTKDHSLYGRAWPGFQTCLILGNCNLHGIYLQQPRGSSWFLSFYCCKIYTTKNSPVVTFGTLTVLGDHHHCPVSEHFPHPKRKSCTHLAVTPHLPPSPCLKQPLICFLFLRIYLFWIFHISGIIQYCVWLLSLCIMFSRFTHFIACVSTSFLFMAA